MSRKKEIFNYLFFGGLTTLMNIVTYFLVTAGYHGAYKMIIANIISWIASVSFAYVTNKKYVFNSQNSNMSQMMKEFVSFMGVRLLSLFIDTGSLILFAKVLGINELISKIIANVIVVVFNYFASKYFIFRKKIDINQEPNA
ncbi:GtrA family protein [Ectobacillus panaciterrae]|uniref:GtrA family protein n=1 Tax=Ectobacillus panaciterrae TaxID=363872 RepID=UPI0003FCA094|nr:GtrA family protein [Ectobacillus panaciterrae]